MQSVFVVRIESFKNLVPGGLQRGGSCGAAHFLELFRVFDQAANARDELGRVPGDKSSFPWHDQKLRAAGIGDHGGYTRSEGLKNHVAERVGARRKRKPVHVGVGAGQSLASEHSGQLGISHIGFEPGFFGPLPDDDEADIPETALSQRGFKFSEKADVFLDGEPADVADDEITVCPVAAFRRKKAGVHAAMHGPDRLAGSLFEHFHQLRIGSEKNVRKPIKPHQHSKRRLANRCAGFLLETGRQRAQKRGGTAFGVFVEVCVPGGGDRNAQTTGHQSPELAGVARARDVDDIRIEPAYRSGDPAVVAPECKIETMLLVQVKSDWPATAGDACRRAIQMNAVLCAAADDQEGEPAFSRERLKLAAGVRHAVDFLVSVGKVRDSKELLHGKLASWPEFALKCI